MLFSNQNGSLLRWQPRAHLHFDSCRARLKQRLEAAQEGVSTEDGSSSVTSGLDEDQALQADIMMRRLVQVGYSIFIFILYIHIFIASFVVWLWLAYCTWHTSMVAGMIFLSVQRLRHYPMRGHQHLYVQVSTLQHIPTHHDNNKMNTMPVTTPIKTTLAIKLIVILLRTVIITMQVVVTFMCL